MTVTADQAFEARGAGEPIMISAEHATKLVASHDQNVQDFLLDAHHCRNRDPATFIDLAEVLEWLGY